MILEFICANTHGGTRSGAFRECLSVEAAVLCMMRGMKFIAISDFVLVSRDGLSAAAVAQFRDMIAIRGLTCQYFDVPKNTVTSCALPRLWLSMLTFFK